MRWAIRSRLRWVLVVSLMIVAPSGLEGLVGAIRLWPPPAQSENELLGGELWVECGVDMSAAGDGVKKEHHMNSGSSHEVDIGGISNCKHGCQGARRLLLGTRRRRCLHPQDPLVLSTMKKEAEDGHKPKKKKKKKEEDSGGATTVAVGLSVAGAALAALLCLCCCCCCACRDSAHDGMKDDKPLLSLSLSDLSGSSRKSCSTPIDVSRLGALSSSLSEQPAEAPVKRAWRKPAPVGGMSMKVEMEQNMKAMRLNAHEITTIAGAGRPASPPAEKAAAHLSAPAAPAPPPPAPAAAPAPPPPPPLAQPPASAAPAPAGPPPPPAPKRAAPGAGPPPPAMPGPPKPRGPPPLKSSGNAGAGRQAGADSSKTKLKPFFWDKVTASPDQAMVWDQIKAGSFQFNEEMMESLFGCHAADKKGGGGDGKKDLSAKDAPQFVRILDPKKAQNLAISLKALSVSAEDVRTAAMEGHELPVDLIQTLLRWMPTSDEELRLRLYTGEATQLGPAEQFLRTIMDVPHVYQRLEALLLMAALPEEAAAAEQSFRTLEVACQELRGSRLFKKLLEAVLKTGNRMNDGTFRGGAQAFKLDTLLKLSDVKGVDGKTTLLHFVVLEIVRSEGVRAMRERGRSGSGGGGGGSTSSIDLSMSQAVAAEEEEDDDEAEQRHRQLGLAVVSGLGEDLQNVRRAACIDSDALTISVASLGHRLVKAREFLSAAIVSSLDEDSGFQRRLAAFLEESQLRVTRLLEEEKKLRSLVRATVDYFHGSAGKDEGLRLFVVVRDFLAILDKVCREVKEKAAAAAKKPAAATATASRSRGREPSQSHSSSSSQSFRQHLLPPAIQDRWGARGSSSSSSSSSDSDG